MGNSSSKVKQLNDLLSGLKSVVVAFSGGVDSSFLAVERALGNKAIAITAYSETLPESEKEEAILIAKQIGIKHILLNISELDSPVCGKYYESLLFLLFLWMSLCRVLVV